jgi:hypothetical protein
MDRILLWRGGVGSPPATTVTIGNISNEYELYKFATVTRKKYMK